MAQIPQTLHVYVISDGRAGIENQALGLAEALKRHVSEICPLEILPYHIAHGPAFKTVSPKLQFTMKSRPQDYGLPSHKAPQMAIGCGRQAIAPLLALKKAFPDVMTIYVQDPRMTPAEFDLVIAPEHDGLRGDNVENMIGSPNRITDDRLIGEMLGFSNGLTELPMPRAAMLIGGTSKTHRYSEDNLAQHIAATRTLIDGGLSLLITTSRRTPDFAAQAFEDLAAEHDNIWLHSGRQAGRAPNPYFAFLGGAEIILVTQDSTNMLTEACSTGKPVFTLPMTGKAGIGKANEGKSGKFQQLYDRLTARCHVVPHAGQLTGSDYEPLDETTRVAAKLWMRYEAFTQVK
ncbi:MAG: mitochondrial fission ELM1 family protein [Litorimonas sp.]